MSWRELKAINDALAEFMRLIGREPDAVEHVFAEPGRPREHYDIPLVLLVEMLRRRDGLSVRAATRKASALTIGKGIRLFPQSENTLRKRYQRDCKTLGVQMLLESTKELSIEKLESLVPNVSRAFRLTTETQCDAIFPAEDSFPPGAPCRWPVKPRTCVSIVPNVLD